MFYGWGGEDDDFYRRVSQAGLKVIRFGEDIAQYRMLKHKKEIPNPDRFKLINTGKMYKSNGLGDVSLNYTLVSFMLKPLYTLLLVNV